MKFIKEFSNWNPILNLEVDDYIKSNTKDLLQFWNKELSDRENMDFIRNLLIEYPQLMKRETDWSKITSVSPKSGIKNMAPTLMNIGGVKDFRSF
jgi:argonaute-like protein implicated in RNA metabolism and viral defense